MTSPINRTLFITVLEQGNKSEPRSSKKLEIRVDATVNQALEEIKKQAVKGKNLVFHEIVVSGEPLTEKLKKDPSLSGRNFFEFLEESEALDLPLNVIIKSLM